VYAVIETGGRQYKVTPGEVIEVNRLPVEAGQTIELDQVLLIGGDESGTVVGKPTVAGARVRAKVSDNFRSRKIIVFKYKNKTRYRRFNTHRQDLTRLVIKEILPTAAEEAPAAKVEAPTPVASDVVVASAAPAAVEEPTAEVATEAPVAETPAAEAASEAPSSSEA
jgi:large subunit ribosomal protein L21